MTVKASLKKIIKEVPGFKLLVVPFLQKRRAQKHVKRLNDSKIFFTASPTLLPAIFKAFDYQRFHNPELLQNGAYYEFGIFKGFALWFSESISRNITGNQFRHYGFDSFAGLPKTTIDKAEKFWPKGAYRGTFDEVKNHLVTEGTDFNRLELIKGWFSKELFDEFFRTHEFAPAALLVIDSDIFESCDIILRHFYKAIVPGTIILFDDYNAFEKSNDHGERLAVVELQKRNPNFKMEHFTSFGQYGEAFIVTSI